MNARFNKWLDTFVSEKGIDPEQMLTAEGPSGTNFIPVQCLVDMIKQAPRHEQAGIKSMIVRIDFKNGDVLHYFQHLAQAIAR
jgi:hypothetical protein